MRGGKYGLLPKADPAHLQQLGDWHRIAVALRESRIGSGADDKIAVALSEGRSRSATVHKAKLSATTAKSKARKTAVASAKCIPDWREAPSTGLKLTAHWRPNHSAYPRPDFLLLPPTMELPGQSAKLFTIASDAVLKGFA